MFIRRLLAMVPGERWTATEAIKDPFVSVFSDPATETECALPVTVPYNDDRMYPALFYKQVCLVRCCGTTCYDKGRAPPLRVRLHTCSASPPLVSHVV